jgi:hypothetical protein
MKSMSYYAFSAVFLTSHSPDPHRSLCYCSVDLTPGLVCACNQRRLGQGYPGGLTEF